MFIVLMVSRLRRRFSLVTVLLGFALLATACEKVPLLAPSGSTISLVAGSTALPINGSTDIVAQVIEPAGTPPHSGTRISFTTNLGTIQPAEAETDISGRVTVKFNAGTGSGTATITAISGGVSASGANAIKIAVGSAAVGGVSVSASPTTLPSTGGTSTIIATVIDASGNPLPGVPVTFAIDTATAGSSGSLSPNVATTDASGKAQSTLTTSRTTTVTATAGIASTTGTTTTAAQSGKVTVTVNTTTTISIGTPTPATPTVGQTVTLPLTYGTAATASPITRVSVDWGDGQSQSYTGQPAAVSHVYRSQGSFLVVVTGVDSFGDASTTTTSVTISAQPRPTITISTSTANPQPGLPITFTIAAAAPTGSNTTIQSITVDFGDGSHPTTLQGNATSVQHVYASSGTYTVTAIATDSNGSTGSGSTVIVIGNRATPTMTFSFTPPTGARNTTNFVFTAAVTNTATGVTVDRFEWNFGDGVTRTTSAGSTTHVYTAAGTWVASVTAVLSDGTRATSSVEVPVTP